MSSNKKNRFTQLSKQDLIFYIVMAAIPVVQFCIFYIGVKFNMVTIAFKEYDMDKGVYTISGINQFQAVINTFKNDPTLFKYALNSVKIYALSLGVSTPLGLSFSYYIYKKNFAADVFRVVLFMPAIISPMVTSMVYTFVTDSLIPKIVYMTSGAEIGGLMQIPGMTFWMLFFYSLWTGFGTSTLLYVGAMSNIDVSVTEAAKIDGVTPFGEFIHIVFPLILPTFSVFVVTGLGGILTNGFGVFNFFGRYAADSTASYIPFGYWYYVRTLGASLSSYPMLSAIGLIISAITIPVVFGFRKLLARLDPMREVK